MATTGFWPVRNSLETLIAYADNPDKTTDPKHLDDDLPQVLRYTENDDKTDRRLYVTGINCTAEQAYEDMAAVQKRFGLKGQIVAYHGYQSFKPGEVMPEEAHQIGIETAERMWGARFRILVTTHLNTDSIHNHMVVNAVSYKDGRKFQNHIRDHIRLREISDTVCWGHSLSVLEGASFYGGQSRGAYWAGRRDKLTHRAILKRDIEDSLRYATSYDRFIDQLRSRGYTYDWQRGSVQAPDWERALRLDRMGYSYEYIMERIAFNLYDMNTLREVNEHLPNRPKRFPLLELEERLAFTVEHSHDTATVMIDLVFLNLMQLLQLTREEAVGERPFRPLSPSIRAELVRFDQLHAEYMLLSEKGIHTQDDLSQFIERSGAEIKALERERQGLRNRLCRPKAPEVETEIREKITEITAQAKPLRKDLAAANRISERWRHYYELLQSEREMEIHALQKERNRAR